MEWQLFVLFLDEEGQEPRASDPSWQLALLPWPQQYMPVRCSAIPKTARDCVTGALPLVENGEDFVQCLL